MRASILRMAVGNGSKTDTSLICYVPVMFHAYYALLMPKPPTPADLKHCLDCGKVIGPHKGWFGPECQCHLKAVKGREARPRDPWGPPPS